MDDECDLTWFDTPVLSELDLTPLVSLCRVGVVCPSPPVPGQCKHIQQTLLFTDEERASNIWNGSFAALGHLMHYPFYMSPWHRLLSFVAVYFFAGAGED